MPLMLDFKFKLYFFKIIKNKKLSNDPPHILNYALNLVLACVYMAIWVQTAHH